MNKIKAKSPTFQTVGDFNFAFNEQIKAYLMCIRSARIVIALCHKHMI